jgi:hypothetical protein
VKLSSVAHTSFWAISVTAFLCVSAPRISQLTCKNSIQFAGPFHSTDTFLFFDTGQAKSSDRLTALFETIPSFQAIVVVDRSDDRRSTFIGMIVAYLAWPHPVRIINVLDPSGVQEVARDRIGPTGAFVFCRVAPPPSFHRGQRFGTTLEVVTEQNIVKR